MTLAKMDPNENWGKKTVKLRLLVWDYEATHEVVIGGNTLGFDVMNAAVSVLYDDLPSNHWGLASLVLTNPDGEELQCDDEEQKGESWLAGMVVAAEIASISPEQRGAL